MSLKRLDLAALTLAAALVAFVPAVETALGGSSPLTTTRVTSGLVRPIFVTHAPNDYSRIFIIEKQGRIRIFNLVTQTLLPTSFLDIDPIVGGGTSDGSEQGLLGLAFHPNYAVNGVFYVNYTDVNGDSVVASYRVSGDPNIALTTQIARVLFLDQPFSNHNGGWIDFGPDGYLYCAFGDGGSANDPGNRAQTITNQLLGKMLRLDVDGADDVPGNTDDDGFPADTNKTYTIPAGNPFVGITGDDEIWAFGLRNPWRNAFDRLTGDLYIADVGQGSWEEINFQPASSSGGENYGWRCMEGNACTGLTGCTCNAASLTDPIQVYSHGSGCSITGGYVYRGCAIPDLQGTYFYADYCSNIIWSFEVVGGSVTNFAIRTSELAPGSGLSIGSITSFGEDAYGEIYIADQSGGEIFKIIPRNPIVDCNANLIADACDIASGLSQDRDSNGIPDECQCFGDLDGSGTTDETDLGIMLAAWQTGAAGDLDGDSDTDEADLGVLLADWGCN